MRQLLANILISILTISSLVFAACTNRPAPTMSPEAKEEQMHREHAMLADNLAHQGITILEVPFKPFREFGYQMNTFFSSYLMLENALVKEDKATADIVAEEMKFLLDLFAEPLFEGKAELAWSNHKEQYLKSLLEFLKVENLKEKRFYFSQISEVLYCTFKSFDLELGDIHLVYCPVALNNQGAYWLTDNHKIRNPYFGDKRLKCGSIVGIFP